MKVTNKKENRALFLEFLENFTALGGPIAYTFIAIFLAFIDFEIFVEYAVTIAATIFVLIVLRSEFFSKRPKGKTFHSLFEKVDNNTKFSGHSATSFASAISIGLNTNIYAFLFLLVFAFFIGLSRIKLKKHYPINVINGALIGIATSLIIKIIFF